MATIETVDMITAAIDSVRSGRARGRRITGSGAWGIRFQPIAMLGFHVVLRGEGWLITVEDEPVALRPGDLVFTAAETEHGLAHAPRNLAELRLFPLDHQPEPVGSADFEFLCGAYSLDGAPPPAILRRLPGVVALTPDRGPGLPSVVELLLAEFTGPGPSPAAGRSALIDLVIVYALSTLRERGDWPLSAEPGIAEALHQIHERPERPWSVLRLSAVASMSPTSFARRFTATLGVPPMTYLTEWRLVTGARLLRQTDTPLAGIARQVGYGTEFAFAAAFRRHHGIPPGRYRSGCRQLSEPDGS